MAIRGTYELNARPARQALRELRGEAATTERAMRSLGDTMDRRVATPTQTRRLQEYERRLTRIRTTSGRLHAEMQRDWSATERRVVRSTRVQGSAVDSLQRRLDRLGATRVSPQIDVDGIAAALAQVELLHARLNALGRERAAPGVVPPGVGGGFRGGGRGREGLIRSIHLGPLNLGRAGLPLVAGLGLPAGRALVGGAGALLGTAGAATLGAGALGITGAGVAGVGGGLLGTTIASMSPRIEAASDALVDLRETIRETGAASREAREAQRLYNQALAAAPAGTRGLLRQREMLGRTVRQEFAPAQGRVLRAGMRGLRGLRGATPFYGRQAARALGPLPGATGDFAEFLGSAGVREDVRPLVSEFARDLPLVEQTLENVTRAMLNLARAGRPFFHDAVEWLESWTRGWARSTDDLIDTRRQIGSMIDDLKLWIELGDAAADLTLDVLGAGRRPGRGLVADLTGQLREWERWIERNPRQVRGFFQETADDTREIASALGDVVAFLEDMADVLRPTLRLVSRLADLLADIGAAPSLALLAGLAGAKRGWQGAAVGAGLGAALGGGGGTRGPGGVRGAVGGFARGFLPVAGGVAGLEVLTAPGAPEQRIQAGLSSLSMGIIPYPRTRGERSEEALAAVGGMPRTLGGARRALAEIRGQIAPLEEEGTRSFQGRLGLDPLGLLGGRTAGQEDQLRALRAVEEEIAGVERAMLRTRRTAQAMRRSDDLARAFEIRLRRGERPQDALDEYRRGAMRQMGRLTDETAGAWGRTTARWLREIELAHPKLRGEVDNIRRSINRRFERMGEDLKIINGRIRDTSAAVWEEIRKKLVSEAHRARVEATAQLSGLQRQAIEILMNMGISRGSARNIIEEMEQPGLQRPLSGWEASATQGGGRRGGGGRGRNRARGGRMAEGGRLIGDHIGGRNDHIPLGDGGLGAGGELIVNRHTEQRVDRMLRMMGTSLGEQVKREGRPHSGPMYAAPGTPGFRERNAAYGRRYARGGIYAAGRLAQSMGLHVGEGPGYGGVPTGGHAPGSLHYQGLAYDVSGDATAMRAYFHRALRMFGGSINELFHDPIGWYIDNGQRVQGAIGGHGGHVHIGFFPGGARGSGSFRGAGPRARDLVQQIERGQLQAPASRARGLPGAASNRRGDLWEEGMRRRINDRLRRMGGGAPGGGRAPDAGGQYDAGEGARLWRAAGGPAGVARLMGAVMMAESGGNPRAIGIPTSGGRARGLWQIMWPLHAGRFPGMNPFDPMDNARMAVEIYRDQGIGAWEAHTLGMHRQYLARGGRMRWAGMHAAAGVGHGSTFRARGATGFVAGEGGRDEDVTIRPARKRAGGGGRAVNVAVNMGGVTVRGDADVDRLGERVGRKILEALRDGGEAVEA